MSRLGAIENGLKRLGKVGRGKTSENQVLFLPFCVVILSIIIIHLIVMKIYPFHVNERKKEKALYCNSLISMDVNQNKKEV